MELTIGLENQFETVQTTYYESGSRDYDRVDARSKNTYDVSFVLKSGSGNSSFLLQATRIGAVVGPLGFAFTERKYLQDRNAGRSSDEDLGEQRWS
jgi:hypothetical protein